MFLTSCPFYLQLSPAIQSAWRYRMHWDRGQLDLLFPGGVPIIVIDAIEQLEFGYNAGLRERQKEPKK